jgi:hypothetical protein
VLTRARGVTAGETVEEITLPRRRDARPIIDHLDHRVARFSGHDGGDRRTGRSMDACVGQ